MQLFRAIRRGFASLLAMLLLLFVVHSVQQAGYAQVLYGSLVGTVTDPSGASVPGAELVITETGTGQVRHETTDASGRFNVVNLLPGTYDIKVTAPGFKTLQRTGLVITPSAVVRLNAGLEVGQAAESVTVAADVAQLQTEKASTTSEITSKQVTNVPLGGYRNYQTLINLVPGAMPGKQANSTTDAPDRSLATNINGGNAQTNVTRIDGAASINAWLPNHVGYVVPAETVDIVNVTTSAADADQGLAGASAITVVTKSGTNELHGSAFGFFNNQALNARNYFLPADTDKPASAYKNYGATLGGPIVKNKLFYFTSFDGTNQSVTYNGLYTVPTADQRNGDFSAYNVNLYNPFTGNADGSGRQTFAGNLIPTNMISPIAQAIQNYFPNPNLPGTVNNYSATVPSILDRYYFDTKINWNRNDKHTIWGKYGMMRATAGSHGIFGEAGGPSPDGNAGPGLGHTFVQVGSLGHTYTFSPNLVLDGTVSYQRIKLEVNPDGFGTNYGQQLGIPGTNGADILESGFPYVDFGGYYSNFGVPSWMPERHTDETYSSSHNLTWTKGAHEFRFGFDMTRIHLNHWQPELSDGGPRGYVGFNGSVTSAKDSSLATSQYNAYAQFLLGESNLLQKGEQYILMTGREWQFGWYVKDRWQISKRLTLDVGLRYELYPLMTRSNGKGIERYDPATNNVYLGGRGDVPTDAGITVSHKLFAPRAGLAYRLDDKTVIRSGYGINYDPLAFSRPLRGFYPLTINSQYVAPNSFSSAGTLATGVPIVVGPDLSTGVVQLPATASERSPYAGELHRGYVQSWNFTIERKLPYNLITSIAYVGQHSVHLLADKNINAGYPDSGIEGLPYYQQYGRSVATNMWDGYLSSNYNSLQVAVNRSFSNGLMVKGAYTWAKAIDYTDDDGWASVGYNWDPVFQRNRAAAGFDRTHVLQLAWVYELPMGKNKPFAQKGLASKILGDWQVGGMFAAYTGNPLTVTASDASLNDAGSNTQTANQLTNSITKIGAAGPGQFYYDPTQWAPVTTATFGNSGRNTIRGPGVINTDLTIMRGFSVKERMQIQFRTEFYNLTNTPQFANPDVNVNDTNFMQITSASGERNIRFGLRLQW